MEEVGQVDRGVLSGGVQQGVDVEEERVERVLLSHEVKAHHEVRIPGVHAHGLFHISHYLIGGFESGEDRTHTLIVPVQRPGFNLQIWAV